MSHDGRLAGSQGEFDAPRSPSTALPSTSPPFRTAFERTYDREFPRLCRILDRACGDPELARDLAQEAFVRLYRRGSLPESPGAWLVSVGLNLMRNALTKARRRGRILESRWEGGGSEASAAASILASEERVRVRAVLDRLPERERDLLLLRAEGFSYAEMARALDLRATSVGTLLARARKTFRSAFEEASHAS